MLASVLFFCLLIINNRKNHQYIFFPSNYQQQKISTESEVKSTRKVSFPSKNTWHKQKCPWDWRNAKQKPHADTKHSWGDKLPTKVPCPRFGRQAS